MPEMASAKERFPHSTALEPGGLRNYGGLRCPHTTRLCGNHQNNLAIFDFGLEAFTITLLVFNEINLHCLIAAFAIQLHHVLTVLPSTRIEDGNPAITSA